MDDGCRDGGDQEKDCGGEEEKCANMVDNTGFMHLEGIACLVFVDVEECSLMKERKRLRDEPF